MASSSPSVKSLPTKPTRMPAGVRVASQPKVASMLDTSAGSKPLIAARTSAASSTARQIGPILSRDQQRDMAPARETRPNVGRKPKVPHRAHGATMEPNVSVPIANAASPAAVAAAEPALDPRDPSSVFQGLRVWPPYQMSPKAN